MDLPTLFPNRTATKANEGGMFAWRAGVSNAPLYLVSSIEDQTRLACVVSRDNGAIWREYALGGHNFANRVYAIGGCREVTNDGYIIGTFTDVALFSKTYYEPHSGKVYFFKIRADPVGSSSH